MSDLFTPPRLFSNVRFHRHTDRSIGWLELFYDLIYVATLIQIGNFLSDNLNMVGFGQFLVLMVVVWWAWTGETFYQNRYYVDDVPHRLLVFTQIFAIATMGLSVSEAFGDLYVQFTLAYVVTRFMLLLMYVRASRAHPESRELSMGYVRGFSIGIAVWLGSLLLPAEIHWVGWLLGIAVELSVPLQPRIRERQRQWGVDVHHITERFGIFTIIVLGESFVKVLDTAQGYLVGAPQLLFSLFGLGVVYSLWWLYFSDTAGKAVDFSNPAKPFMWIYGHLPLAAGLIAFGVAAKKLFASSDPDKALNPDYTILYTASIVMYLAGLTLINIGLHDEESRTRPLQIAMMHLISAIIVGAIGVVALGANALTLVTLISVVMVGQVLINIYQTRQQDLAAAAAPHAAGDAH